MSNTCSSRNHNQGSDREARTDRQVVRHSEERNRERCATEPENPEKCVGINVGILKYAHDSDGTAIRGPDLSEERERLE